MKALAIALLAGLAFAVAIPASAKSSATVSVTPAAPVVGDALTFSGCGYAPNDSVTIVLVQPMGATFAGYSTDASGCFVSSGTFGAESAGAYSVSVYHGRGNKADAVRSFSVS